MADYMRRSPAAHDPAAPNPPEFDDTVVTLLDAQTIQVSPAWERLQILIEDRGLAGWTYIRQANKPNT